MIDINQLFLEDSHVEIIVRDFPELGLRYFWTYNPSPAFRFERRDDPTIRVEVLRDSFVSIGQLVRASRNYEEAFKIFMKNLDWIIIEFEDPKDAPLCCLKNLNTLHGELDIYDPLKVTPSLNQVNDGKRKSRKRRNAKRKRSLSQVPVDR